jgi:hypothetical protein
MIGFDNIGLSVDDSGNSAPSNDDCWCGCVHCIHFVFGFYLLGVQLDSGFHSPVKTYLPSIAGKIN